MSAKLLVFGHVNGGFTAAFKKIAALHAKNQFAFAIATGNLFGKADDGDDKDAELDALLAGRIEVPLTTYFTVGTRPFPPRIAALLDKSGDGDGDEICPNLHYLGKRSVTKTAAGLRIVALGGLLVDDAPDNAADGVVRAGPTTDACLPFHSVADEASLRGAHGADILLTAIWPRGITRGSHAVAAGIAPERSQDLETAVPTSDGIADLVAALRPRYHLTASPDGDESTFFYEREGFFHPERPDGTHSLAIDVTRFISLARWGNAAKAKALYAFALSSERPAMVPAGCTPSPFLGLGCDQQKKKRRADGEQSFSRFAQDADHHRHDRHGRGGGKRRRGAVSPPPGPDRCFFCLSNPNLPTHMVACIGDDAYVATAKGPLPASTTFAEHGLKDAKTGTPFPGHLIIVPLSHAPTIAAAASSEDRDAATRTYAEMTRFRASLQAMVAGVTQRRLGAVTWEISRQRNVHVHWQFVPVPAALATGGLVEAAFRVEAANMQLPPLVEEEEKSTSDSGGGGGIDGDYFRVWIWGETDDDDGGRIVGKTLVMHLDEGARFDLQYGRKVVAKLLGLEATRTVWQECTQSEAEETADVTAFREAYAPWDFTLQG